MTVQGWLGVFLSAVLLAGGLTAADSNGDCRACHEDNTLKSADGRALFVDPAKFGASVHGQAGLECIDCHADLKNFVDFPHPLKLKPADCASCHEKQAQDSDRGIHRSGRAGASRPVPRCAGCHGSHDIRGISDPQSTVNPANLDRTCGRCHAGEGKNFRRIRIHVAAGATARYVARAVKLFYIILIAAVVSFSLLFILADVLRSRASLKKQLRISPLISEEETFERMGLTERIQHGAVILAFVLLALTGIPLLFPGWKIFGWLSTGGSGFHVRGVIHRTAAVILIVTGLAHAAYAGFTRRGRQALRDMRPRAKDVRDAVQAFGYNLGLGRFLLRKWIGRKFFVRHPYCLFKNPPLVDHYTFVEKFEYWALIWGTLVMIVSGFFMWKVELSLSLFPSWLHSLFSLIHGYEATLAILAVLIWHMYHAHLRAGIFPMSRVWLNGAITGRELRLRHPLYYQRIHQEREKRRRLIQNKTGRRAGGRSPSPKQRRPPRKR